MTVPRLARGGWKLLDLDDRADGLEVAAFSASSLLTFSSTGLEAASTRSWPQASLESSPPRGLDLLGPAR
jgi:hypothetical protein